MNINTKQKGSKKMSQQAAKKSIVGSTSLKSSRNNKLIAILIVVFVALVGGFFVFRSFAVSDRRVFTPQSTELQAVPKDSGQLVQDGTMTVLNLKARDTATTEPFSLDARMRLSLPAPTGTTEEKLANTLNLKPNASICAYVAVLNKNGQLVSASDIAQADPGTESRLLLAGKNLSDEQKLVEKPAAGESSAFNYTKGSLIPVTIDRDAHILGGQSNFRGVGNYRKYCWENSDPKYSFVVSEVNFWVATDKKLNSILKKEYQVHILKVIVNDFAKDEPINKTP